MSFYRFGLAASITLLVAVMSSAAFAGCGGCGGGYTVIYAQPQAYAPLPIEYAQPAPVAPLAYAPPPQLIVPAPIAVDHWDTQGFDFFGGPGYGYGYGGCGCGCGRCAQRGFFANGGYAFGGAPAPLYFVNQGPQYSGPAVMLPYPSYAPSAGIAAPWAYPYVGRYRYGAYPYYAHRVHHYWHRRPLHSRG